MNKILFSILILFHTYSSVFAQNKSFFDRYGNAIDEVNAYYYRENISGNKYVSYYKNDKTLYFEGNIINASTTSEASNKYSGVCTWYYKKEIKKSVVEYNENGILNGMSKFFGEDGKLRKEIIYVNGTIKDNTFSEYEQNGTKYKVFEELFENNNNDWDLFKSQKSSATIKDKSLVLESLSLEGTSRYIPIPLNSDEFILEAEINFSEVKKEDISGIIYGFKDWDNYNYFTISNGRYYTGNLFEGINNKNSEGYFPYSNMNVGKNILKVICGHENTIFSLNGIILNSTKSMSNLGNNYGFCIKGKGKISVSKLLLKSIVEENINSSSVNEMDLKGTGSGVLFNKSGYIFTNYHVIDGAKQIFVDLLQNDAVKTFKAEVIITDKVNDLAIIKILELPKDLEPINYSFKAEGAIEVGESVFTIGFPLALSGMGKDPKFTDGKISSKRGYEGSINSFQTTIPVQPGNSGGPVYNDKGQLIGLINAKVANADNVSYAIKLNHMIALVDIMNNPIETPKQADISSLNTESKVKILSRYSVIIKVK